MPARLRAVKNVQNQNHQSILMLLAVKFVKQIKSETYV